MRRCLSICSATRTLRGLLRQGLEQGGVSTWLPRVTLHKKLEWLLRDFDSGAFDETGDDEDNDDDGGGGGGGGDCSGGCEKDAAAAAADRGVSPQHRQASGKIHFFDGRRRRHRQTTAGGVAAPFPTTSSTSVTILRVVAHPASALSPRLPSLADDAASSRRRNRTTTIADGSSFSSSPPTLVPSSQPNSSSPFTPTAADFSGEVGEEEIIAHTLATVPFPALPPHASPSSSSSSTPVAAEMSEEKSSHCHQRQKQPEKRLLVAIGPDGGWAAPAELDLFQRHGFRPVTLLKPLSSSSSRAPSPPAFGTLKTEVALAALLARAHERLADEDEHDEAS